MYFFATCDYKHKFKKQQNILYIYDGLGGLGWLGWWAIKLRYIHKFKIFILFEKNEQQQQQRGKKSLFLKYYDSSYNNYNKIEWVEKKAFFFFYSTLEPKKN